MTGTRAPLKIVPTHRTASTVKTGSVPPADKPASPKPKLLDQLRESLRSRHYSRRTDQTYCQRVKRFIFFHHVRHPTEMAEPEINAFLTNLAVKVKPLQAHLQTIKAIHEKDLAGSWGRVAMPDAMDRKYPNAPAEWRWQWVFPLDAL